MSKIVNLTEDQKRLFKEYLDAANHAATQAQMWVEITNTKRKALDDLLAMFCISNGLVKERVKIDSTAGTAIEEAV